MTIHHEEIARPAYGSERVAEETIEIGSEGTVHYQTVCLAEAIQTNGSYVAFK
jgi:hypothetical protein